MTLRAPVGANNDVCVIVMIEIKFCLRLCQRNCQFKLLQNLRSGNYLPEKLKMVETSAI